MIKHVVAQSAAMLLLLSKIESPAAASHAIASLIIGDVMQSGLDAKERVALRGHIEDALALIRKAKA